MKVVLRVDSDVDIPADAKAVIVAQSLVTGRFVQLTPVYDSGEKLANKATIPMERTVVPMEWDDIKAQLSKLSESLGPQTPGSVTNDVDKGAAAGRWRCSTRTCPATVRPSGARSPRCPT